MCHSSGVSGTPPRCRLEHWSGLCLAYCSILLKTNKEHMPPMLVLTRSKIFQNPWTPRFDLVIGKLQSRSRCSRLIFRLCPSAGSRFLWRHFSTLLFPTVRQGPWRLVHSVVSVNNILQRTWFCDALERRIAPIRVACSPQYWNIFILRSFTFITWQRWSLSPSAPA